MWFYTGRVPHDQVPRYYNLVDVLAYARHSMRLTKLVTPLKPFEAMTQGRVLVASEVGGHRELIRHDETDILFKAGSADKLAKTVVDLLAAQDRWPPCVSRAGALWKQNATGPQESATRSRLATH